jgi:hypothetical protein
MLELNLYCPFVYNEIVGIFSTLKVLFESAIKSTTLDER